MPTLTIAAVTGHDAYTQSSVYAIERSFLQLHDTVNITACLLVSPTCPEYLPHFIQHIPCKPFSYLEYNLFMLYGLAQLVQTDFCLVVQNDGFVINGKNWRDDFFEYDYIGAPVPYLIEVENQFPKHTHKQATWLAQHHNPPAHHYEPQNGGFSLRSRRLLNASRALSLNYQIPPHDLLTQIPVALTWSEGWHHEDTFLTASHRATLEQHGLRFASTELAAPFSVEHFLVHTQLDIPIRQVLGIHSSSDIVLSSAHSVIIKRKMANNIHELIQLPIIDALLHAGINLSVASDLL